MGTMVMLQNRPSPWSPDSRVVYSWPLDVPEAFCIAGDIAFTDDAHRVIVHNTGNCALHVMAEEPCIVAWRSPPECRHERINLLNVDRSAPQCATCGLVGADVSARWLRTAMFRDPVTAPSEVLGDEAVMLGIGRPGPEEES